jgi:hypothetical protein
VSWPAAAACDAYGKCQNGHRQINDKITRCEILINQKARARLGESQEYENGSIGELP